MTSTTYMTTNEAGEYLRVAPKTLANWRCTGGGPPFVRFAGCVRYAKTDLDNWAAQNRARSTSDRPVPGKKEKVR